MKPAQWAVKHLVKEGEKAIGEMRENNMRTVSECVRTITGLNTKTRAVEGQRN